MNKTFIKKVENGRIKVNVNDESGFIHISGGLIPYRCKNIYEYDDKYVLNVLPQLEGLLCLNGIKLDTKFAIWYIENSMYFLFNGEIDKAQKILDATDEEIMQMSALCRYGLHYQKFSFSKNACKTDDTTRKIFEDHLAKTDIQERRDNKLKKFYEIMRSLN